jgi:hypothetical protein
MARKAAVKEAEPVSEPVVAIAAIKAFDADLRCSPNGNSFQFEIGGTYKTEGQIVCCSNGFHAVLPDNPLHVWDFYGPVGNDGRLTRYADVVMSGATDTEPDEAKRGTKIAAAEISVKVEITLPEFIKRAVTALLDAAKGSKETAASGDSAKLAASGDSAKLAASGDYATLAASGDYARLAASGHSAQLAASGDYATLAASGDYARLAASGHSAQLAASGHSATLAASGDSAQLAASGYSATLAASGDYAKLAASGHSAQLAASGYSATLAASGHSAQLAASGYSATLAASGQNSVIAASAPGCTASGADGTWISLAEFVDGKCVGFATGCIGRDGLKPNTAYRARDGKLVEA